LINKLIIISVNLKYLFIINKFKLILIK
jgi:hypothetical protein